MKNQKKTKKKKNPKPNPDYNHKEGGDHLVDFPPHLKEFNELGYKAYKYNDHIILKGGSYDTLIIDEILGKIKNNESVVIAITGPPGTGKTYLGEYLAMFLDKRFHIRDTPPPPPEHDDSQVTFERPHIMYLTGPDSPLKRGQVILMDEIHFGMGARGWQNRDQQDITNYVAAIRSKGYVLIFIVLHTEMVDKMVRDFVINYEIHVTNRGKGLVYRRWFPQFGNQVYKKRLGAIEVPIPDTEKCNYRSCLRCKHLNPKNPDKRCTTIRAIYERRKEYFLNQQNREDEKEEKKTKYNTFDEVISGLVDHKNDIPRKANGEVHKGRTITWLKQLGFKVKYDDWSALIYKIITIYG